MYDRIRRPATLLWIIIAGYVIVATLYAGLTPLWQIPDEPAHYNYARFLAENKRFPVLQAGDYPHEYLEEIKGQHFPPEMSIDPIRYEFHQPPLYYILSAIVYGLFVGASLATRVIAMRLFSVILGGCLLFVTHRVVNELFPARPALALGTAAFIAFLPMHVSISAGVTNDPLAELLVAGILLALVRYLKWRMSSDGVTPARYLAPLGILMGLGLLTKTTVYYALPAVGVGLVWGEWQYNQTGRRLPLLIRSLLWTFGLALLIGLLWFVRNSVTYGGLDILGLGRHGAIVEGQLRTADWLAGMGLFSAIGSFLRTTFQSFWGQFGWMGVLIDGRLYMLLQLVCGLAGVGASLAVWRIWRREVALSRFQWAGSALLGIVALTTLAGYFWYNVQFVQHQGRYLFPALIPIGLLATVGLWTLFTRRGAVPGGIVLAVGCVALLLLGLVRGDLPLLWLAVLAALAGGLGLRSRFAPANWTAPLVALAFAGLWLLDLVCLFGFIIPALA